MSHLSTARVLFVATAALCALTLPARAQRAPDDCGWESGSKLRRAVKLRTVAAGESYADYNLGRPIRLPQWYAFTCSLDARVPSIIPESTPLPELETVRVRLRGYLVGARFERDEDHDIQAELAASPEWNSDHVLIEMPAGRDYCAARHALWELLRRDGCRGDECIMRMPIEVTVTGYLLLGGAPPQPSQGVTSYCQAMNGRGISRNGGPSHVRGAWRLQPVLSVEAATHGPRNSKAGHKARGAHKR